MKKILSNNQANIQLVIMAVVAAIVMASLIQSLRMPCYECGERLSAICCLGIIVSSIGAGLWLSRFE